MNQNRQLAAIMFTDIVGYTAIMGRDENKALSLLEQNRSIQIPCIKKYNGKLLKELGDGTLVQFNSAYDAVVCAKEIQQYTNQRSDAYLRIGIHLGDITTENGDVFGDGVNVASRIQTIADPGGIYISESVANAIRNHPAIEKKFLGEARLKNVDYPVRIFAIQGNGLPKPHYTPPKNKKRIRSVALLVVVGILGFAGWMINSNLNAGKIQSIRSIVVLPTTNMTGSDEHQYLADGLHDALITRLSHIQSLRVISRHTANGYAKTEKSSVQIAKELNVDAVLETSMLRADDSIQLNAQLIQVNPEEDHLWADIFNQSLEQVLGMISNVTQRISKEIRTVLSPEEKDLILVKNKIDPELYKKYIKGKLFLEQYTPEGFKNGIQYLNEVIKEDPAFAPAYAAMSIGYGDLAHLPTASQEAYPHAKALAERALDLDPTLTEANTAMGEAHLYFTWEFNNAEKYLSAALAVDSSFAPALIHYGWLMDLIGEYEKAEYFLRKATEVDPLAPIYGTWLGWWYWIQKRYDEGIAEINKVFMFSPGFPVAEMVIGGIYADMGKFDEAIQHSQRAATAIPQLAGALGMALAKAGKSEEAYAIIDNLEKTVDNSFSLTNIYYELGEKEEAYKWLQVLYKSRHRFVPWVYPILYKGDNDPRVKSLYQPIFDSIAVVKRSI